MYYLYNAVVIHSLEVGTPLLTSISPDQLVGCSEEQSGGFAQSGGFDGTGRDALARTVANRTGTALTGAVRTGPTARLRPCRYRENGDHNVQGSAG